MLAPGVPDSLANGMEGILQRLALAIAAALVLGFAAATWWALESGGVAVVETRSPDGSPRSTHVWYVERDGALLLEAGSPENGWFRDIQRDPLVTFRAEQRSARYLAQPLAEASAQRRVRSLLREKYGFRDRWVGLLVDSSRSVAVELLPSEE
jgi:hypothetical protein